ncbi:MAG: metal ABC transporter substrate-binding protein [Acidimicrobiales bacterium]
MPRRTLALVVAAGSTLAACGSSSSGTTADGSSSGDGGPLQVVASFYPLQYAVEQVGGDAVSVTNLTKPGAEPHDLELNPRDVAAVVDADLVVYLSGFQPAVDESVAGEAADRAFDVAPSARLDLTGVDEEGHGGDGAAADGHAGDQVADPHFWLDPTRLADVGDAVAEKLAAVDPGQAGTFRANAAAFRHELEALDAELSAGLGSCANTEIVTSHEAFGYLAQRYGLTQVGITGLNPEAEPDAATIAEVADFVTEHGVATIYYETLVSPAVAETVAAETGAETAVLDPIEGISAASAAQDYVGVMRANLAALRAGQPCS